MYAMDKDDAARTKGFVDKVAGTRHMNEKVLIGRIVNRDPHLDNARLWVIGGDGFRTD